MTDTRLRLIIALVLVALTLSLHAALPRYEVDNRLLVAFGAGLANWRQTGTASGIQMADGVLRLEAATSMVSTGIRRTIMRRPDVKYLRLSAWVSHDGVSGGAHAWNGLRVILTSIDQSGNKLWELPHTVEQSWGSGPWRHVTQVFFMPPRVTAVEIFAGLSRSSGRMQVRDLNIEVVHERPLFRASRLILTLIWLLAAPWLIWPLWRQRRLAVLAVGCTILVGTLTPHSVKLGLRHLLPDSIVQVTTHQALTTQTKVPSATPVQKSRDLAKSISAGVAKSTVQTSSKPIGEIWRGAHKLGHVGFFALLAFVGGWRWPRQSWRRRGLLLVVFAVAAETLQLLTPDRSAQMLDAGLNMLGIMAGFAILFIWSRMRSTAPDLPTA